ncbi:MAG: hypothetical protein ACKO2P_18385, partial [Planctomycetota bacterium]
FFAQASFWVFVKQQQPRQQSSALRQPQDFCMQGKGRDVSFPGTPCGDDCEANSAIGSGNTKSPHNVSTKSAEMRRRNRACRADF